MCYHHLNYVGNLLATLIKIYAIRKYKVGDVTRESDELNRYAIFQLTN